MHERLEITRQDVLEIRHYWCRHPGNSWPGNSWLGSIAVAADKLTAFRAAVGSAVGELTGRGVGPDPA